MLALDEHFEPVQDALEPKREGMLGVVVIAEDIRNACGITQPEAFFAYNSAKLRGQDKTVLEQLAARFTTGKLKGREMRLVGRGDWL